MENSATEEIVKIVMLIVKHALELPRLNVSLVIPHSYPVLSVSLNVMLVSMLMKLIINAKPVT